MTRRLLILALGSLLLAGGLVCTPLADVAVGLWLGEPFYRGLPARYWGRAVAEHYRRSHPTNAPRGPFAYLASWLDRFRRPPAALHGAEDSVPVLVELLRHPDEGTRWRAVCRLAELDPGVRGSTDALRGALDNDDPDVRAGAAGALLGMGQVTAEPDALAGCLHNLRHGDVQARAAAARALRAAVGGS